MAKRSPLLLWLLLGGCVTVNIYFPAAAVERAADQIIKEIQTPETPKEEPQKSRSGALLLRFGDRLLALLIPPAHAQARIDISSPEIEAIKARMKQRFAELRKFLDAGWVGYTRDGLVAVVDPSRIPLRERARVERIVQLENRDRLALYRAIAAANGHPEWADEVQEIFARRWIANAQPGWWIQLPDGRWVRK